MTDNTKIEFEADQGPPIFSWLGFWKKPLLEVDGVDRIVVPRPALCRRTPLAGRGGLVGDRKHSPLILLEGSRDTSDSEGDSINHRPHFRLKIYFNFVIYSL